MNLIEEFSNAIIRLMIKRDMDSKDLAAKLGITLDQLNNMMENPSLKDMAKIGTVLGVKFEITTDWHMVKEIMES